uniref:Uncharacterized protein n=1 Tax=Fagus sylvatica TaxID=28930 RepID=A0A2N9E125_FAGSY
MFRSGMDLFYNAKTVRLRCHHDKYLLADEDEESVTQDRNGSSKNARWTVEFLQDSQVIIRLKSCYNKYLTASNQPFLLGVTGRKVIQSLPRRLDSSVEWEPIKEGSQVKLKTRYGNFLRANGGVPPWRNSITHDIPHRTATQDWILWYVDTLEIQSSDSSVSSPPKSDGRTIYYHVAEDNGDVDDETSEGYSLNFKGNGVEELTRKLVEDTGLEGIIVCTRNPLNGNLYPLRLQLPPNNATMHVVLVLASSTCEF